MSDPIVTPKPIVSNITEADPIADREVAAHFVQRNSFLKNQEQQEKQQKLDEAAAAKVAYESGTKLRAELTSISDAVKQVFTNLDDMTAGLLLGLSHAGCPFAARRHVDIIDCGNSETKTADPAGFYNYQDQRITLCHDYWKDKSGDIVQLRSFMARHLVSAFDHCKTDTEKLSKEEFLDFKTCSTVRSLTLTGQCLYENMTPFDG